MDLDDFNEENSLHTISRNTSKHKTIKPDKSHPSTPTTKPEPQAKFYSSKKNPSNTTSRKSIIAEKLPSKSVQINPLSTNPLKKETTRKNKPHTKPENIPGPSSVPTPKPLAKRKKSSCPLSNYKIPKVQNITKSTNNINNHTLHSNNKNKTKTPPPLMSVEIPEPIQQPMFQHTRIFTFPHQTLFPRTAEELMRMIPGPPKEMTIYMRFWHFLTCI